MTDVSLQELIDCWKADERNLSHQAEQRLIGLAVAEVERLQDVCASLRALRESAVERLRAEQKRIAVILKCPDMSEDISVPSNLPNVIRDKLAEAERLQRELALAVELLRHTAGRHGYYIDGKWAGLTIEEAIRKAASAAGKER